MNSFTQKLKISTLLLSCFIIFSAFLVTTTDSSTNVNAEDLNGCWVYKNYKDGQYIYGKSSDFKSNKPGFKFEKGGKMVKRLDPNWCARVAGPYTNLDGTWEKLDGSTLKTVYQCPIADNPSVNKYKIVELTGKKLILKSLPRDK